MGAIIGGLTTFLGVTVVMGGMPVVGVIISVIGGAIAGYVICSDMKN